jgi:hypothetical protein
MGRLLYGDGRMPILIEDRALAHLKVVISTKLRRGESFTVSWRHPDDQPQGRSTIWVHPTIPLRFEFDSSEPTELNPVWIEHLSNSTYVAGILLVPESSTDGELTISPADE